MDKQLATACLERIQARMAGRPALCDLCGGSRWHSSTMHNMPGANHPSTAFIVGGESYSYIALSCVVCGNTKFINVVTLLGRLELENIIRAIQAQNGADILQKASQREPPVGNNPQK